MFIGQYEANLDEKGRVAVPNKFRQGLKGKVIVTRGLDNSLFLYPLAEWKTQAEKLASLPVSAANSRAFARLMLAGAVDVDIDKQGRILIPQYLQESAGLSKKLVFAGLYKRIELWSEENWKKYQLQAQKDSASIAEQLGALGI